MSLRLFKRSGTLCSGCDSSEHTTNQCPNYQPGDYDNNFKRGRERHEEENAAIAEIVKLLRSQVVRARWPNVLLHAMASAQKQDVIVLHQAEREQLERALKEIVH
jgi:hypothetical protein